MSYKISTKFHSLQYSLINKTCNHRIWVKKKNPKRAPLCALNLRNMLAPSCFWFLMTKMPFPQHSNKLHAILLTKIHQNVMVVFVYVRHFAIWKPKTLNQAPILTRRNMLSLRCVGLVNYIQIWKALKVWFDSLSSHQRNNLWEGGISYRCVTVKSGAEKW